MASAPTAFVLLLLLACIAVDPTSAARTLKTAPELPPGACLWQQQSLIGGGLTGAAPEGCLFQVRDPRFLDILPKNEPLSIKVLAADTAHEGGVWLPDDNSFYYTKLPTGEGDNRNVIFAKVNLATGEITEVLPQTPVANGLVLDREGNFLIAAQGKLTTNSHLLRFNPKTQQQSVAVDNWFGLNFNSPNDIVVAKDGTIYFTDPAYGFAQKFRPPPKVAPHIYRISPDGKVDVVARGLLRPNGLALSADEKKLYVTDTGFVLGDGTSNVDNPHSIEVFDIAPGGYLQNRRLFAAVANFGPPYGQGIPDGIKVDTKERVYAATLDGIQVFDKNGVVLGLIRNAGTANMGFAGPKLNQLVMINDKNIQVIQLSDKVRGAGLHYAEKFLSGRN